MNVNLVFTKLRKTQNAFIRLNDDGTYTIMVNSDKPYNVQRESILHEVSHIINGDFHIDLHADIIERIAHARDLTEDEIQGINFYTHVL